MRDMVLSEPMDVERILETFGDLEGRMNEGNARMSAANAQLNLGVYDISFSPSSLFAILE